MKDLKSLNLITSEKKFKEFIKTNDNYKNSLNQQITNNISSSERKNSDININNMDLSKKSFKERKNEFNEDKTIQIDNSNNNSNLHHGNKTNVNFNFFKTTNNENLSKISNNSSINTNTIQSSLNSINVNSSNAVSFNQNTINSYNKTKCITGISIVKSNNLNTGEIIKTPTQNITKNEGNNIFSLASLDDNKTIESKKRSVSECSGNLKNNLNKENEEDLLINDENGKLVDKYLLKQGIKNKVDFNNNFSKLKIYKKILEETNRFLQNNDDEKNNIYNIKRVNLSESEILSKSNTNSKSVLNTNFISETVNNLNELNQNLKLIDLSNKFIVLHQENSELKSKLKEKDNENSNLNKLNSSLNKEIESLKIKLDKINNLNGINNFYDNTYNENNNQNRLSYIDTRVTKSSSINYQINNNNNNILENNSRGYMSQDCNDYIDELNSRIASLSLENEKLHEFKNNIIENSKTSDLLNMSIIESMKNANLIIDHFNLSGIRQDDIKMKKLVEDYISK